MKNIRRRFGALGGALLLMLLTGPAGALPVAFNGSFDGFTPGAGYGQDVGEVVPAGLPGAGNALRGGTLGPTGTATLLDVVFTNTAVSPISFTLAGGASTPSSKIGEVTLFERVIDPDELDQLNVSANFTFVLPGIGVLHVTGAGTAVLGPVPGAPSNPNLDPPGAPDDLSIIWTPLVANFGDGGSFRIDMSELHFTGPFGLINVLATQTLDQNATITLLTEPAVAPEPVTLALVGFGLVGLGFGRRKRAR